MLFDTPVHSIKNIKFKIKDIVDVEAFMVEFKVVGLEVETTKDHYIIPFDFNRENVGWQTEYALATAYATSKPFDLGIEIQNL